MAVAHEQEDLVRKARRYEVELERQRELARQAHFAELERQRADKRERCVWRAASGLCGCRAQAAS